MKNILLFLLLISTGNTFSQTSLGAKNDFFSTMPINAATGGVSSSVLANDTVDMVPNSANLSNVTISWLSSAPTGIMLHANGTITVAPGTTPDIYRLYYRICGSTNTALCDEAYAVLLVDADSDGDGVSDFYDADNDNDGIVNTNECVVDLASLTAIYIPNNYTDNNFFLQLRPSDFTASNTDFGVYGSRMLNGFHDYSSFFGLPSGSIIVEAENANVHPTADQFYVGAVSGTSPQTLFKISGSVGVYLAVEHGVEYPALMERGLTLLHGATPATGLVDLGTQPTGGNWVSGNIDQYYFLRRTSGASANATLTYADVYPARKPKLVEFSTNTTVPTNYSTFFVRIFPECDSDKDGIPNRLDLDSDNDGCLDALEGSNNYLYSDLVNAGGNVHVGIGSAASNQNLCADGNCIDESGIPTIVTGGQEPGTAYNQTLMSAECIEVLPAKLSFFHISSNGKTALLEWATSIEQNNNGFEIEKSTDGLVWERLAFIKSLSVNGNSSTPLAYSFSDHYLSEKHTFYRLKQIDYDGRLEYSEIRRLTGIGPINIIVFPNPATEYIMIKDLQNGDVVEIYDYAGKKVKITRNNSHTVKVSVADLAEGMYNLLVVSSNGSKRVGKFVKKR